MIFGDYLTVMLLNMAAGLFILGAFFLWGVEQADRRVWCPGFAIVGLVAMATGLHMTLAWPIPGKAAFANIAFGEMTVLLGAAYLGAALATGLRWAMHSVALYAFVAGMAAVVLGVKIQEMGLTAAPAISATGFIVTGLAAMLTLPVVGNPASAVLRRFAALLAAGAGALWLFLALSAYWKHIEGAASGTFMKW